MAKIAKTCTMLAAFLLAPAAAFAQESVELPPIYANPGNLGGSGPTYPVGPVGYYSSSPLEDRFYGAVEGGVLGLSLPGVKYFQILNENFDTLNALDTEDGSGPAGMIGGSIGFRAGARYSFEARGFVAQRDHGEAQVQVDGPGTAIGAPDILGGGVATDVDGLALGMQTGRDVLFANFDLIAKYDVYKDQFLIVSSYGGYSMFQLDQTIDILGTFYFPGGGPTGDATVLSEELNASYQGVVFGFAMTRAINAVTTFGVDGSIGVYRLDADRNASQSTFGPNVDDEDSTLLENTSRTAVAARLKAQVLRRYSWCDVALFASINWLDAVPYVEYGNATNGFSGPSALGTKEAGWYTAGAQLRIPF